MLEAGSIDEFPVGFKLRYSLSGHKIGINQIAWSPNGRMLASSADDYTDFWNVETGVLYRKLNESYIYSVSWSPDGRFLASGGILCIRLWDSQTGKIYRRLIPPNPVPIFCIIWSPDGKMLASGAQSESENLQLWDVKSGQLVYTFRGHSDHVRSIAWSPDGCLLASGSGDRTIRLWDTNTGRETGILEGHIDVVTSISFSFDGRLLASKSCDGTVQLWRSDTLERVAILSESSPKGSYRASLAFYPKAPVLATLGEKNKIIRIWDLDFATILGASQATPSVYYTNAKVVLVGDNSVGKSGLGLVLTDQQYVSTDSTHGRNVWTFDSQEVELNNKRRETRETLLWDLAGQPGYRVIHQLSLNDVAVALIIFDARSETDPFVGVHYWNRALQLAQHAQGSSTVPTKKFLVAARIDRGGKSVSHARINSFLQELGFDGYYETSAKEGRGIKELIEAIKKIINWEVFPKVSSTELFRHIKDFLVTEKEDGRLLSTIEDLYRSFLKSTKILVETEELYCNGYLAHPFAK